MKRTLLVTLCGSALLASAATAAFAEPIKFVVPFAAGGAIAGEFVARSAPDGKTVLFGSFGAFVLGPILKPPPNYDPVKSFQPVMLVGKVPSLVVVNKDSEISTLADLIVKAKQQKLSYGS